MVEMKIYLSFYYQLNKKLFYLAFLLVDLIFIWIELGVNIDLNLSIHQDLVHFMLVQPTYNS